MIFKTGSRTRRRATFFCAASATAPALLYLLRPCSRKESSQRKGGPIAAHVLRSSHLCPVGYLSGDGRMGFLPICRRAASMPHPLCPWVLRAVPDKYCGARRGKREKSALLRNVSYLREACKTCFAGLFFISDTAVLMPIALAW